ncbi:MAG: beta-ketoacyl-[Paludibacteraceae bacterium]|nr:beta-ketoacyl-[acyl-carrier-protein] synthase family protein [Paludibacteraceae bacterium]
MKIAITGIGIISAIGNDQRQTVDALLHEQTGVGTMHYLHSNHTELPVGEVKMSNDELLQKLNISSLEAISRTALLGLHASREALQQAKITDVSEMAFISGTTVGGMDTTERFWSDWQKNRNLNYVSQH